MKFQKSIVFNSIHVNPGQIQIIEETCKNFKATLEVKTMEANKIQATAFIVRADNANALAEVFYWIGSTFPFVLVTPMALPTELAVKDQMYNG